MPDAGDLHRQHEHPGGGAAALAPAPAAPSPPPPEIAFRTPFPRPRVGALRNILVTVAVGAVIIGLIRFLDRPAGAGASQAVTVTAAVSGPPPRVGKPAPDFTVQTLDGKTLRLSELRGQPVWINFWATWCPPCRAENPDIEAVYREYKDRGLVIVAISIGEDADTVRGYIGRTGLTYAVGLDSGTDIAAAYRIVGIPTHFFVDASGVLRAWRIGSMYKKVMQKKVSEILPAPGKPAR